MAITKILLSGGGTDGKLLASDGNNQTIHTASSTATDIDEVWLWATNVHTADVEVTVGSVSYTHLRAHETPEHLLCRSLR